MTVPRWLREHRRAQRPAARPDIRGPHRRTAADVAREPVPLESFRGREPLPDEEWEPFIAAIREARGW